MDKRNKIKKIYRMTPMQEGMLFDSLLNKDSSAYKNRISITVKGKLNLNSLEKSFNKVIERHDIFRTIFNYENNKNPIQIVLSERISKVELKDISKEQDKDILIKKTFNEYLDKGFDLTKDILIRLGVIKVNEDIHILSVINHHINMDGWCTGIIISELLMLYNEFEFGISANLQDPYPYSDYVEWLMKRDKEKAKTYWKHYLKGYDQTIKFPMENGNDENVRKLNEISLIIDNNTTKKLDNLALENKITINNILQGIWAVLLQKYNGSEDVVFGCVVSGRNPQVNGIERMVGLFVNTLPLRVKLENDMTFLQLIKKVNNEFMESNEYDYFPLSEIKSFVENRNELFNHIMVYQNYPVCDEEISSVLQKGNDLQAVDISGITETSLDLSVIISKKNEIKINFQHNMEKYPVDTVMAIKNNFRNILNVVLDDENILVRDIEIIDDYEKEKVVKEFNNTKMCYSNDKAIHQLFEEQTLKNPDSIAITFKDKNITYRELNEKSNQVANYLKLEHNINSDTLIGIYMERSPHMVIAILAVLKAGGAYVPIDSTLPLERIKSMIDDGKINIILSTKKQIDKLNILQWECKDFNTYICLDSEDVYCIEETYSEKVIDQKQLWDYVAKSEGNEISKGGWVNSYTREPFSKEEMEEYVENTFQKLKPYLNEETRVLEIGCASGLTMFKVAPYVKSYYGTDLSQVAIEKNKKRVLQEGISNIKLECIQAHEIDKLKDHKFDIIIINSVVQYFPGVNYLRDIISKSILLSDSASILFIGDVMNHQLKYEMLKSFNEFKKNNPQYNSITKTKLDSELFVPKEFFYDIELEFDQIEKVELSNKIYTIENELTQFRYDCIFKINKLEKMGKRNQKNKYQLSKKDFKDYPVQLKFDDRVSPKDLAYIIYTSGSTGNPKGVMIEHGCLNNYTSWVAKELQFNEHKSIIAIASISFDISILEILVPLTKGMRIVILDEEELLDPEVLLGYIKAQDIKILQMTPSRMQILLNNKNNLSYLKNVEEIILAGEVFPQSLLNMLSNLENAGIYNAYGPTETTIWSTIKKLTNKDYINIGKPVGNTSVYILDKYNKIVPIGVSGELCIAGDGVARGYLFRDDLTVQKFVENPFCKSGQLLYKTGDIARWNSKGEIEFIGRKDNQVKIRGYRIEIGEVETALLKIDKIKEVVVVPKEVNKNNSLVAYYVSSKEYSVYELREELKDFLADYMIPSYFIKLDRMPLTKSGKINRNMLPEPNGKINTGIIYELATSEEEIVLLDVWKKVLGINDIGINDDFFNLGGDSIKSIQIISKVKAQGYHLEIKDLFKNPNIKGLSKCLKKNVLLIKQEEVSGEVELTPMQRWFFEMGFEKEHHWNQAVMLFNKNGFEQPILEEVFNSILVHHDALRMVYKSDCGNIKQFNRARNVKLYDLSVYDYRSNEQINEDEIKNICTNIQSSINLEEGPVVKLGLFKTDKGDHLLIAIHHLVIDGVSWRILFEDLQKAYSMAKNGQRIILQDKTTSFKEWASEQKKYANSYDISKELEYWGGLENYNINKLPKDKQKSAINSNELIDISFELTKQETENLLKHINKVYNTEINDILLTALALTINKWSGHENVLVNLESHGREQISKSVDITRTIGWFTSQYPVVLVTDNEDISMMIKNTKDRLRRIPNKGIGYGIIKYLSNNNIKDKINLNIKPEICFNYLGQFDEDINNETFNMSYLNSGNSVFDKNKKVFSLYFSAVVIEKKLKVGIKYRCNEYEDETIEFLASEYKNNLINIIDHCMDKHVIEKTAADITKENINLKELHEYMNELDNIKNIYTLTPMQDGMLYHAIADGESEAYHVSLIVKVKGELDINILEQSFNKLIERHDILRTNFDHENFNKNMQIVFKERKTNIKYVDISNQETDKEDYIKKLVKEDSERGFNLNKDILTKLTVIKTEEDVYSLIFSNHHIIIDGWCLSIIAVELFKIYNELKYGNSANLKDVTPYSKYIEWLNNKDVGVAEEYWTDYLKEYNEATLIPFSNNNDKKYYKNNRISFNIEKDVTRKLELIARNNKVTVNTIMQSLWSILLQKYNNSNDSVFGYVVSGRNPEVNGIENMLGLFINTIPLRVKTENNMSFKDLLIKVNNSFLESSKYDYYSLARIQALSEVKEKLINNIMAFENYPIDSEGINNEVLTKNDLEITDFSVKDQTNYNFSLTVVHQEKISINFNFNEAVYTKDNILRIKEHFENLINEIVENEEVLIKDIDILSNEEKQKLLIEFNNTSVDYPKDKKIHELFEEQVEKTPDNIAVVFEERSITYKELNEQADKLAYRLMEKGVKRNDIVGLMINRSIEMIVGIIGILKSGGAYLPIDPENPKNRIKYILNNSGSKVLVTTEDMYEKVESDVEIVNIMDETIFTACDKNPLKNINSSKDLAYIIYTSGSTGQPKGVAVEHRSVNNLVCGLNTNIYSRYNKYLKIALVAPYYFDASVKQIFASLLNGNSLYIIPENIRLSGEKLINYYEENSIEISDGTPVHMNIISEEINKDNKLNLKHFIIGGDQLRKKYIKNIYDNISDIQITNVYGPTECCVDATSYLVDYENLCEGNIAIGKPMSNYGVYITDKQGMLTPIGVPGELCIGGDGVGRGYLNNEELTAEKFIENPYKKGDRIYKTGDLAKWLPNGNIECLGRIDYQVKIRGYRIELGEIEKAILNIRGVKETVVIEREDKEKNKHLCAYVVLNDDLSVKDLRNYLTNSIPEYMIPAYFVQLDKIPVTINGKLDRKTLLEHDCITTLESKYEAPRNEVEEVLCKIWSEILAVKDLGINDNFFDLGGDSLKAMRLVARVNKILNVEIPLREIFNNVTIKDVSKFILLKKKSKYVNIEKAIEKDYYETSAAQKRMFIINQLYKDSTAYNMPLALVVEGNLNIDSLKFVFNKLIERHENLRTSFILKEDVIVQKIHNADSMKFDIELEKIEQENIESSVKKFVKPFDLEKDSLLRVKVLKIEQEKHILLVDMHHIISDAISRSVLTKEVSQLYSGQKLEDIKIQYRDFSEWQNQFRNTKEFEKQEQYWVNEFKGDIPLLKLPTDYERPIVKSFEGDFISFLLDKEDIDSLRKLSKNTGTTMFMVLLSALNILISKYSGQQDVIVGTTVAGRDHSDLENVIGMFVNTLPIRSNVDLGLTYFQYLNTVKDKLFDIYENQEYQFDQLVEKLKVENNQGRNPLFDIMFSLQNVDSVNGIDIGDLKFKPYENNIIYEKFDITIIAYETKEKVNMLFTYATSLFKKETMEKLCKDYVKILKYISKDTNIILNDIDISYDIDKFDSIQVTGDFTL